MITDKPIAKFNLLSLVVAAIAAAPVTVQAQNESTFLEEIIVTAQKRAEGLQDVAIAISAFGEAALERGQIEDATDLQLSIPNAILVGNENLTIRGIGGGGVGSFINSAGIGQVPQNEFYDLERIEVLRGPQGTLYGRNTTGGAVNIITRKPDQELGGYLDVQLGNYQTARIGGALNLPISENIGQRFAGYSQQREGFTENVYTGNDVDSRDQWSLRSTTSFDFGDTRANLVLGYYEEDSSRARETKRLCTADPVLGCSNSSLGFDSPDTSGVILQALIGFTGVAPGGSIYANAANPTDLRKVAADYDPTYEADQFYATFDISHDFGDLTLTSITGYNSSQSVGRTDWDNAALPYRFSAPITYSLDADTIITTDELRTTDSFTAENKTWTQELRLSSDFDSSFNFTGGIFYADSKSATAFETWHPSIEYFQRAMGRPEATWHLDADTPESRSEAWAVFGETYFDINADTKLTLGARYTDEERSIRTRSIVLTDLIPYTEAELSSDKWTGKIAIDHSWSDNTLVFASLSSGFKSAGLNPGSDVRPQFGPETVVSFEIGSKSTLLDGAMRANLAAFFYDYSGLQLSQRIDSKFLTSNADAEVWGLEAELEWAPSEAWLFDSNLSYLHSEIQEFMTVDAANPAQSTTATSPETFINLAGNELPHSPEFKIKVGAQYTWQTGFGDWDAILRADVAWQSDYFAREFNSVNDKIDAWGFVDLYARLNNDSHGVLISAYVKNLTNENNLTSLIIEDALVGRYRNARILEPRTFGIVVKKQF